MFDRIINIRATVRLVWVPVLRSVVLSALEHPVRPHTYLLAPKTGRTYPSATYANSIPTSVNQSSHTSSLSIRTPNPTAYFLPNSCRTCLSRSKDVFDAADRWWYIRDKLLLTSWDTGAIPVQ